MEFPYIISTLKGGTKKENKRKGGSVIGSVTRGEGLKKYENFEDVINGSS